MGDGPERVARIHRNILSQFKCPTCENINEDDYIVNGTHKEITITCNKCGWIHSRYYKNDVLYLDEDEHNKIKRELVINTCIKCNGENLVRLIRISDNRRHFTFNCIKCSESFTIIPELTIPASRYLQTLDETDEFDHPTEDIKTNFLEFDTPLEKHTFRSLGSTEAWDEFAQIMHDYVDGFTQGKYKTSEENVFQLVDIMDGRQCIFNCLKYALRVYNGRGKRHDIQKIAHYAQFAYFKKLEEDKKNKDEK